ncbi:hypothetical protein HMPREF9372_3485 [Sporosarcina newyorkensis 2681]|uniref:DUF3221 domain-containing protein n=1 Tax=Sporosarcina newyorkensis 2681 TaxID=1027292 RepID=F9DXF4_9BACL|nr:DUF3221 domain-containing protein [Sporosarcina newyorkensis]EGQ20737.1 hypothetical protein HMPREF9372_3485 [Sporosarcina newyorkensis 2681]
MKKRVFPVLIGAAFLIGGCGTAETSDTGQNASADQDGWQTVKKVAGREIIAELEQSVEEFPLRDEAAAEQINNPDYKAGFFGKPSKELEEDMAVQAIEGPIAIEAVEDVYGGNGGFEKEGVLFIDNQADGAAQSGIWIGVKNPDERVQQVIDILQPKVDEGKILAKPIYIFRSPHTQHELYRMQDEVAEVLKSMKQERGSFALSVNTKTGVVEIGHDYLKPEQQKELEEQFPDYAFRFKQEGNMVAEPGESAVIKPAQIMSETPVNEGGFIMGMSEGSIFVSGGTEGATNYSFTEAGQLTVGQRVKVEATGGIAESYPAQGAAKFVEILPDYKPAGATLSESQAVAKAIKEKKQEFFNVNVITEVQYDGNRKLWILEISDDSMVEVEDR